MSRQRRQTAADHFEVLRIALEQLLLKVGLGREILVHADTGGRAHGFMQDHEAGIPFSIGYEVEAKMREAIPNCPIGLTAGGRRRRVITEIEGHRYGETP